MYVFQETTSIPSKIAPGVAYIFRNMTEDRRLALQTAVAAPNAAIRALLVKLNELKSSNSPDAVTEAMRLNDEMQRIVTAELNPAKIKWGLSAITGLGLGSENAPATIDNLMRWPSPIVEEVLNIIDDGSALSEPTLKNSESPTTSGAVEATTQSSTIAPPADETAGS